MKRERSMQLWERARKVIPGGVNSPVRAFKAVGGNPIFIARGEGPYVFDADGNRFIDYVCSWGALFFGHAFPPVVQAVADAAKRGTSFGAPTEVEIELAEMVQRFFPSMELVRFVNSGTEATASAIRLARGATRRPKILKCAGCYHGSVDSLLVTAGSGVATLGIPDTAGIPNSIAAETIVVPYNDVAALEKAFTCFGSEIAGFIVEPVAGNMGLVPPKEGYLVRARELTAEAGALLIFDEVISGFRIGAGGAQEWYGIQPDLTCLGKILGGGLPVGAYGGRKELMEFLAPVGPVYQAGTLAGNPISMAAGIAMLRAIQSQKEQLYPELEQRGHLLADGLRDIFAKARIPACVSQLGSLLTVFFTAGPVWNYEDAKLSSTVRYATFFHAMLSRGVALPPSQFECWFISFAHDERVIKQTLEAAHHAVRELVERG
ncbi:MAG: glutamate-1-semialdehyde-2,1-aminomutase [Candidatus Hydrogenedentota bacterium]|jgi:glutamate-1-semialdehyde 2,1-aminomutase|nr:glutamate-1-semialdehyde 2,1-aminomutase [Candidatus Sumerlaea chitinivorans]RMH27642.1 MAG: glutamate-1-semialdehyde-2,1-aminomutase [Candidatus Hydrogenedentota bacterium]